ncbi:hypothetical protein HOLleu_06654 [Holothuria leucospilota]|uniref:DUF4549 domain-containing protein n=1 Tax=Holothuria leucospilota TaxID=206669 RepID=A0A9Q1CL76_HOLLE|nr:hypothetical protein HOLleu_06654 [Holothuria leucospilota]
MSSTAELYQVGASEKIKTLEAELAKELQDLKNDIEENEMLSGVPRAASSVGIPKGVEHFRKLREQIIRRAMQVSEAQPLIIQADVMKEEMDNCLIREYTSDSLPLLLHQFFCDRIQQLVQCKHMHMLRWRRFCEHSKTLESLYPVYQKRLLAIMDEYSDAVARAQRLSVVHESLLIGRPPAHNAIEKDDLIIYLKWLICHLHSVKKIHSFIKHLEWFSVSHMHQLRPPIISQMKAVTVPWQEESRRSPSPTERHVPSNVIESKGRWSIFAGRPSIAETTLSSGRVSMETSPRPAMVVEEAESDYLASSGSVLPLSSSLRRAGAGTVPNNPHAVAASAASGGGPSSDPENSGMPCHLLDFQSLRPLLEFLLPLYGLTVDLDGISSTSDEMELAVHVSRKFKSAFSKQEEQKTFPTYDKLESGNESWGADTSSHALLKESNWLPYIKLKPEKDAAQEKIMTKLRQSNSVDELLRAQSKFFAVKDSLKVMDALKEHAIAVRDPPSVQAVSVTSHKTAFNSNVIWRKIYSNPSLFQDSDDDMDVADFDDKDADNVNFSGPSSHGGRPLSHSRRKADESGFDFANAMQMLGLEDEDSPQQDPTMVQGGLLSFLQLRHLRIRDLQRTCLSVLNYFRSLERTLTINDGGLSLEGKNQKKGSTNHVYGSYESGLGGGGSLGYHGYLHNTPADFKQSESDFMEFSDVENHDDFYSIDEGRVHVQDLRGYYVIYDAASKDFSRLSQDLLLVATHYIDKDLHMRKMTHKTSHQAFKKRQVQPAGEVDLPSYGHLPVDRFAVLLDLWTNEAAFLENKRQLIDVYVEAYHHVFDMHERHLLAQVIINLMNKRPRYDFTADYFVNTYKEECRCLRLHCKLIKSILDQQIDDEREFVHKMGHTKEEDGLPYPVITKQPVALNLSRPALKYVYLLEFHPSLSLASRIPTAINFALDELRAVHQPSTTTATIHMEIKLLELAVKKWLQMEAPGSSYSTQMQKDLFSDLFVENPHFVCEIGDSLEAAREVAAGRRTPKEKLEDTLRVWSKLMEIVTTRHRLLDAAVETEILAKIYRKQATEMGFDEYHLFLMCVQFDFASFKENADHPPPLFITALQEDDPNVDRYVFANLNLAIQELDEKMVAAFNFKSRDGVMKLMKGKGLETLQVILMAQVLQKNALVSAVQQVHVCSASKDPDKTASGTLKNSQKTSENRSERSSLLAVGPGGDASSAAAAFVNQLKGSTEVQKFTPESFVSLQLEKRPSRDVMLNHFLNKKTTMGTILKNPEEVEKLKKTLIVEFCQRFHTRICQYSLRGQIIAYLNSILVLLEDFPAVQKSHFVIGLPNEKKTKQDSQAGLATNPRELKKRPRRLLSQDGSMLLNLWFLPHHSEVLIMYKTLENEACMKALQCTLRIVSALHDILQYLCAHSKLGSSPGRVYLQQKEYITADWGGTEGILAELRETQKQVNHLENPSDPEQVADLLRLRRDVLFLEFDAAIRHSLRNTLLSTKNAPGFLKVTENMNIGLPALSNVQRPSMYGAYLRIPEPLQPRDFKAQEVFPWRSFLGRRGPFPSRFWQWTRIESYMQLCLCELKEVDRHAANGEILGVALLMEDVLQSGQQEIVMSPDNSDTEDQSGESERPPSSVRPKSTASIKSKTSQLSVADEILEEEKKEEEKPVAIKKKALSRTTEPVKAYILLKDFLLLWKRLEVFKEEWGQRKLMVQIIDSPSLYQKFCQIFKVDILYPVVKNIASKYGQGDLYEGMTLDDEPIVAPKGASEMELRAKQLVKLLDELEHHMIHEVQRKIAREHALVIAERAREEGNLPTDLWKRPVSVL